MTVFALARVARQAPSYPARLARMGRPPASLWVQGQLPRAPRPDGGPVAVAVVGARAATKAGTDFARALGAALGRAGLDVLSGGAFGIDGAAHEGALDGGAATFAVLGCGADVIYPDRHAALFARIALTGGLLSEYPPGTPPRQGQFVRRNEIIAALADGVVVVEAAARSGALTTAAAARRLGVPVLAVPGSAGTDRLITSGRGVEVRDSTEIFAALAGRLAERPRAQQGLFAQHWSQKGGAEGARTMSLLKALEETTSRAEDLSRRLGWSLADVMSVLGEAEIEGWIRRVPGGAYEVTRGH